MVINRTALLIILLLSMSTAIFSKNDGAILKSSQNVTDVKINDTFWKPKLDLWRKTTAYDVFDKFEGKYEPQSDELIKDKERLGRTRDAFLNFDAVAKGERGTGIHDGPPWYDGLIYESIRGVADLLEQFPDPEMEKRIDGYIDRIAAAQASDPDGYINTYTQLVEPEHRWGQNGGNLRWQHDVYNSGMLFEAAVHYYKATGKTKLLEVAVKFANYICRIAGPAPKQNIVPAHSGPEEGAMKLYWVFKEDPGLKSKISVPVDEENYYSLAKFWIEGKGHSEGYPPQLLMCDHTHTGTNCSHENSNLKRLNFGAYAQDSIPFFQQKTIEGHAVRATLFATGATSIALENNDPKYVKSVTDLWDNMVGKRMFITGGVGAIAEDEKFGPNYYLPNDAYLETCAAIGAGFFSQRMNELLGEGEYIDELERVLYNSLITPVSLSGDLYTYQNPLNADSHQRWNWHGCPCCPPMFLKMVSLIPDFIYASKNDEIAINLFVASEAKIKLDNETNILLEQTTTYPWNGDIAIKVTPDTESDFALKLRIPGWAQSVENPFGLYQSKTESNIGIKVNGKPITAGVFDGYVTINRKWKNDDVVELILPVEPRYVYANKNVKDLNGRVAIAAGPIVYTLEGNFNADLDDFEIDTTETMNMEYMPNLLDGVNVIKGKAQTDQGEKVEFRAIPYYAIGNIQPGDNYKVWIPYLQ
ncbi:glycoside hydrolase family 127 protein [Sunxiuqinia sp. A32]|uniref:glycoside hydrolase family 127 protein n=1 Tax=Sunxiuqinia sp. A32 TaxID=3461496 RepID=UPI0040461BC6